MEKKQPLLPPRVIIALVMIMGLALACNVAAKKETVTETSYSFLPFASAVEPQHLVVVVEQPAHLRLAPRAIIWCVGAAGQDCLGHGIAFMMIACQQKRL